MIFWVRKSQERVIFQKTETIMVTLVLSSEPARDELLEIFLKLSMKTVLVHLIIGMTLD